MGYKNRKVYIVLKLLPQVGYSFGDPIPTINYGVYSSQEKADNAVEECMKKDKYAKFMTERWTVE